jgi:hypothetical protein
VARRINISCPLRRAPDDPGAGCSCLLKPSLLANSFPKGSTQTAQAPAQTERKR